MAEYFSDYLERAKRVSTSRSRPRAVVPLEEEHARVAEEWVRLPSPPPGADWYYTDEGTRSAVRSAGSSDEQCEECDWFYARDRLPEDIRHHVGCSQYNPDGIEE